MTDGRAGRTAPGTEAVGAGGGAATGAGVAGAGAGAAGPASGTRPGGGPDADGTPLGSDGTPLGSDGTPLGSDGTPLGEGGPAPGREHRRSALTSVAMVLGGGVSVQFGGALAVSLMPLTGPAGVVALRLVVGAVVLLAVSRPRLRGHGRGDWGTVVIFGLVTCAMNNGFYESAARIPLGIAVTLEVLGPLALSVLVSRRLINVLWAALALMGVFLLGGGGFGGLDPVGVACAISAGALWATYIVFSARTGRRFAGVDGLALAMGVAGVLSLPLGIAEAGDRLLVPSTLGLGAGVAVLSAVLPFTLEMMALRRLPAATFAVLMSLEPAMAVLAGFLVLHQALSVTDALAVAMVIVASMGAVRTRAGRLRSPRSGPRWGGVARWGVARWCRRSWGGASDGAGHSGAERDGAGHDGAGHPGAGRDGV